MSGTLLDIRRRARGAELPDDPIEWRDADQGIVPFASGWTFQVRVALRSTPDVLVFTKVAGVFGADVSPNVVIQWSLGELDLTPGEYLVEVWANETATGRDRDPHRYIMEIYDPIGPT